MSDYYFDCIVSGSDGGAGQVDFRARRSQRVDAAQDDARMGEILQESLRRILHVAVGRRHPLLHRLRHRNQQRRGRTRRQRKYYHFNSSFHQYELFQYSFIFDQQYRYNCISILDRLK